MGHAGYTGVELLLEPLGIFSRGETTCIEEGKEKEMEKKREMEKKKKEKKKEKNEEKKERNVGDEIK